MKTVKLVKLIVQPFYIVLEDGVITGDITSEKPLNVYEKDLPRVRELVNEVTVQMNSHVAETKS